MDNGFNISLKGKVALVTGGARGIGAECNRKLARAGADIIINHHHTDIDRIAADLLEQELLGLGVSVLKCEADISKEDEVMRMVNDGIEKYGKIDILVHNAAIVIPSKFEEMEYGTWKLMMDVILNGAFLVTRHTIPHMLSRSEGNIVMISSNAVLNGGGANAAYPSAKGGLEGLARQLVKEFSSKGIRTNIIQPAVIDTDMLRERYPSDEEVAEYGKKIPIGRVGKPVDVANAVVFLASDKSSYICGACLRVDGGRTLYK